MQRLTQRRAIFAAGVVVLGTTGCTGRTAHEEDANVSSRTIEEVLATHTDSLMSLPGVVGTAIGLCDGVPCIRVFLADSTTPSRHQIPNRLDGYIVRVEVTGPVRPFEGAPSNTPR